MGCWGVVQVGMMNRWILAMKVHHAMKKEGRDDGSLLYEFRAVGEGDAPCGVLPDAEAKSWLIPTRGTPEYNEVVEIKKHLKAHPALADAARELIALQTENSAMEKKLQK